MLDINYLVKNKKEVLKRLKTRYDPSLSKLVEKVVSSREGSVAASQAGDLLRSWRNNLTKIRAYFVRDEKFFTEFAASADKNTTFLDGLVQRHKTNPSFFTNLRAQSEEDSRASTLIMEKMREDKKYIGDPLGEKITLILEDATSRAVKKAEISKALLAFVRDGHGERGEFNRLIGDIKRWASGLKDFMEKMNALGTDIREAISKAPEDSQKESLSLLLIPNIPSKDIPIGAHGDFNKEIERIGEVRKFDFLPKSHWNLLAHLMDMERAAAISGARFSLIRGALARLERSLSQFMLNFHSDQFEEISPPFLVSEESMIRSGQLPKFSGDLYKLGSDNLYLIPTGEVSLVNVWADRIFQEGELPLRMCALTPCFRREAGASGRDNRGLLRQHQFHKVELVSACSARDLDKEFDLVLKAACGILDALKLPYRIILLCTGDLGFSAEKTIDLEVWMPGANTYREVSSVSSCGDFQGRRMKSRIKGVDGSKEWISTVNGSGLAVGRTLAALLENYQREDGSIEIPEVLVELMAGIREIA